MKKLLIIIGLLTAIVFKSSAQNTEELAIKKVLNIYKAAVENLTTNGIVNLFTKDSEIIESGKVEGNIAAYLDHHLGPELKEFKSFKFSNYTVKVQIDNNYAFTTEDYIYTIILKDAKEIKQKGVATSILQKTSEGWKIKSTHSSARRIK
ncbi:MAG: nuclear transport factor 2 family protein [Oligoflexus sp.]|nr:nuclear transport factor 2 family protein [Pseudopedobacter sp.]